MQTAVGCAQLEKFPSFVERRRHNFDRLRAALADIEDKVILPVACENSRPASASYRDFIMNEARYSRLTREFPERAEALFEKAEETATNRYAHLLKLKEMFEPDNK